MYENPRIGVRIRSERVYENPQSPHRGRRDCSQATSCPSQRGLRPVLAMAPRPRTTTSPRSPLRRRRHPPCRIVTPREPHPTYLVRALACEPAARSSLARWSATKTAIGSATSAARRGSSSSWRSRSAEDSGRPPTASPASAVVPGQDALPAPNRRAASRDRSPGRAVLLPLRTA